MPTITLLLSAFTTYVISFAKSPKVPLVLPILGINSGLYAINYRLLVALSTTLTNYTGFYVALVPRSRPFPLQFRHLAPTFPFGIFLLKLKDTNYFFSQFMVLSLHRWHLMYKLVTLPPTGVVVVDLFVVVGGVGAVPLTVNCAAKTGIRLMYVPVLPLLPLMLPVLMLIQPKLFTPNATFQPPVQIGMLTPVPRIICPLPLTR